MVFRRKANIFALEVSRGVVRKQISRIKKENAVILSGAAPTRCWSLVSFVSLTGQIKLEPTPISVSFRCQIKPQPRPYWSPLGFNFDLSDEHPNHFNMRFPPEKKIRRIVVPVPTHSPVYFVYLTDNFVIVLLLILFLKAWSVFRIWEQSRTFEKRVPGNTWCIPSRHLLHHIPDLVPEALFP